MSYSEVYLKSWTVSCSFQSSEEVFLRSLSLQLFPLCPPLSISSVIDFPRFCRKLIWTSCVQSKEGRGGEHAISEWVNKLRNTGVTNVWWLAQHCNLLVETGRVIASSWTKTFTMLNVHGKYESRSKPLWRADTKKWTFDVSERWNTLFYQTVVGQIKIYCLLLWTTALRCTPITNQI